MSKRTNLKAFRVQRKLSQEEMARKIGCMRSTYSEVERGLQDGRYSFWLGLEKAFNIPYGEMVKLIKRDEEQENGRG